MGRIIIRGGRRLGPRALESNTELEIADARDTDLFVDAAETDIILPGFVDLHCHVVASELNPLGVSGALQLLGGVVACADAGSFGPVNIDAARTEWSRDPSAIIKSWLYLFGEGLLDPSPLPSSDQIVDDLARARTRHPETVVGIKVRLGHHPRAYDEAMFTAGLSASDALGIPLMVHVTNTELTPSEVASAMKPGDVFTHAFHARRHSIISESGGVYQAVKDAQARGVVIDVAHGGNHFSWDVFEAARRDGFHPDVISTDLTLKPWRQDMSTVVSKLSSIGGLPIEDALRSATYVPASILGIDLQFDNSVVVLSVKRERHDLPDGEGKIRTVSSILRPVFVWSRAAGVAHSLK